MRLFAIDSIALARGQRRQLCRCISSALITHATSLHADVRRWATRGLALDMKLYRNLSRSAGVVAQTRLQVRADLPGGLGKRLKPSPRRIFIVGP